MALDWSKVTNEDLASMPANLKSALGIKQDEEPEAAATPAQLKNAFPDDAEFRGKALDNSWTLTQAREEHAKALKASNAALAAKNQELEQKLTNQASTRNRIEQALGGKPTGASAVSTSASNGSVTAQSYLDEIKSTMQANPGMSRIEATAVVNSKRPDLHKAWYESKLAGQTR